MQGNLDPISPYGRAFLGGVQGASPDQVAQRAAEVDKAGLIPFADAIRIKQMADQLSKSGAGMNQPPQGTVLDSLRGQIQSALGPQQMAPQQMPPQDQYAGLRALPVPDDMYADVGMAGGGIVAFSGEQGSLVTGGNATSGPYQSPSRIPFEESLFGKYLGVPIGGFFSRLGESLGEQQLKEAALRQQARANIFGGELPPSGLLGGAPAPSAPAATPAPPAPSAAASMGFPAPRSAVAPMGSAAPRNAGLEKLSAAPPRLEGLPSLLAPSAAQRPAAPPKPTGPSLDQFKKEVDEEYKPYADQFREYDKILKERGADIKERAAAADKFLVLKFAADWLTNASQSGATALGSAGPAAAKYAMSRIKTAEKFAEQHDALTDAQFRMATARAQLASDKSERAYDRFYKAQDDVYKQQALVNQTRQVEIEAAANAQRDRIYGSNTAIGDVDRALVAVHRQRMQAATDSPEYEQLTSQMNQLSELRNILDSTGGGINQRLIQQARQNLSTNKTYQDLLQREQALRVSYANNPRDKKIAGQLEAVIASRTTMETEAKIALENALSGSTDVFGMGDLTGVGNIPAADAEAEVGF
jgi:hypothetical protein